MTLEISLITDCCFRENDSNIPTVACIFVFGAATSLNELEHSVHGILTRNISSRILFTGGVHNYYEPTPYVVSAAKQMYEVSRKYIPKTMEVLLEEKSSNTLENVLYGSSLMREIPDSLCFISKSYHAGRAYLTLKKQFPNTEIFQHAFDAIEPKTGMLITRSNWHEKTETRLHVLEEFLRIEKYSRRGDIANY